MHVRTRAGERGFTMVELLVVILIIGILAMIALPAFIGQRIKGQDTEAQQTVRTVSVALATYHTDHGTFDASRAQLEAIEPTIAEASADLDVSGTDDTYEITETSESGTEFSQERLGGGGIVRSCDMPDRGRCRGDSTW